MKKINFIGICIIILIINLISVAAQQGCIDNSDCSNGEVCYDNGQCLSKNDLIKLSAKCNSDSDCSGGKKCYNNVCLNQDSINFLKIQAGEEPEHDMDFTEENKEETPTMVFTEEEVAVAEEEPKTKDKPAEIKEKKPDDSKTESKSCPEGKWYSASSKSCMSACPGKKKCSAADPNKGLILSDPNTQCKKDSDCSQSGTWKSNMLAKCNGGYCQYLSAPVSSPGEEPTASETSTSSSKKAEVPKSEDIKCPKTPSIQSFCGEGCKNCQPFSQQGKSTWCSYQKNSNGEILGLKECWRVNGDGTYTKTDPNTQTESKGKIYDVKGGFCDTDAEGKVSNCMSVDGSNNFNLGGLCVDPNSVNLNDAKFSGSVTGCGQTRFCAGSGAGGFSFGNCPEQQSITCYAGISECVTSTGGTFKIQSLPTGDDAQYHCEGDDCEICINGRSCYQGITKCENNDKCECAEDGSGYCDEENRLIKTTQNGLESEGKCDEIGCDVDKKTVVWDGKGVTSTYGECDSSNPCSCSKTTISPNGLHGSSEICGAKAVFKDSQGKLCYKPGDSTCKLRWDGKIPDEITKKIQEYCMEKHAGDPNKIADCQAKQADSNIIACDDKFYSDDVKQLCEEAMWDAYKGRGSETFTDVMNDVYNAISKAESMSDAFCGVAASWGGYDSAAEAAAKKGGGWNMCYFNNPLSRFLESMGEIFSPEAMADSFCRGYARRNFGGEGYSFDPENPFLGQMQVEAESYGYENAIPPHILYKIQVYLSAGFLCSVSDNAPEASWAPEKDNIKDLDGWSGKEHLRFQVVLKNDKDTHIIDWDKDQGNAPSDLVLACNSSGFQLTGQNMLIRRLDLSEHPVYDKICVRFLPAFDAPKGDGEPGNFEWNIFSQYGKNTEKGSDTKNPFNVVSSVFHDLKKRSADVGNAVGGPTMQVGEFCNEIITSKLDINVDEYADNPLEDERTDATSQTTSYGMDASNIIIVND